MDNSINNDSLIELLAGVRNVYQPKEVHDYNYYSKYVGLGVHRSGFYGRISGTTVIPLELTEFVFHSKEDVLLVIEGRVDLKATPTNTGIGNLYITGYGFLVVNGTVTYDGRLSSTGDVTKSYVDLNDALTLQAAKDYTDAHTGVVGILPYQNDSYNTGWITGDILEAVVNTMYQLQNANVDQNLIITPPSTSSIDGAIFGVKDGGTGIVGNAVLSGFSGVSGNYQFVKSGETIIFRCFNNVWTVLTRYNKNFSTNNAFAGLSDVSFASLNNKNLPWFELSTGLWKNATIDNILGYTPESTGNKVTSLNSPNDTDFPTTNAVKAYVDNAVVGLLNDRGSYDPISGQYPTTGGSGVAGAVRKGDIWYISATGVINGITVTAGSSVRAIANTPGQTDSNWDILDVGLGYVPENVANKATSILGNEADTTKYTSTKAVADYISYFDANSLIPRFDLKANLNSPSLTGVPRAPTAVQGGAESNTNQIATTAFVTTAIAAIPAPSIPTLASVTGAGNTTTNSIEVGGLVVDMPSGLGVAVEITKGGNGEALTVNKTSGSGNVASFNNGTTLVKDLEVSTATANRPTFFDSSKKLITATGALLGTWFQTLTAKSTPVDADTIVVNDSASSFEAKKTTLTELWTNYLRAFVFSATLTTNRIVKANASGVLVDSNTVDDGTTITSTLNRVFTGASASNNGTGANSNKFLFNGANTIATASFVQIAPEMQFSAPGVGSSLRGMLYLDASSNTYVNNGYTQLYINSGGDSIGGKISLKEAINIMHRSADDVNNINKNSPAVNINAVMVRPNISAVTSAARGVHHITSLNADNYSSIVQAGSSGSNPIHYSAYSQRDNAIGFQHYKDATVSSGILNGNRNILKAGSNTFSNGFGFQNENTFLTNNTGMIVGLTEEYIVQNVGTGTTTSGKRYRHVNASNGVASAYIMGLYAGGVVIGNTTALPNAVCSLDLVDTTKGLGLNLIAGNLGTTRNGLVWYDTIANQFKGVQNGGVVNLLTGSGLTADYVSKWNGTSFVNSLLYDNGTTLGYNNSSNNSRTLISTSANIADVLLGATTAQLRFFNYGLSTQFGDITATSSLLRVNSVTQLNLISNASNVEVQFQSAQTIMRNELFVFTRRPSDGTTVFASLNNNGLALGTATINASAQLDLQSTTKGLGLNLVAGDLGTTRNGLLWYDTTNNLFKGVQNGGVVNLVTNTGIDTLTNKRITVRSNTTTSSATPTINTDLTDYYEITAQTVDITSFTTNLAGTPTRGQRLWIDITGTAARAITWGASFESSTITLPTTTVTTNKLSVGFVWNMATSKWRCVGAC